MTARNGNFMFDASDLSAEVAADPFSGVYVAPASDPPGASGAWVRQYEGPVNVAWFGAVADGVTDVSAIIQTADLADEVICFPYIGTGVYLLDGTFSVANARGIVIDPGVTLKLKPNAGSNKRIVTIARSDFVLDAPGAILDGDRANQATATGHACIYALNRSNVHINLGRIAGAAKYGMHLQNMADSSVRLEYGGNTGNQLILWHTTSSAGSNKIERCRTYLGFGDRSDDAANDDGIVEYNTESSVSGEIVACSMDVAGKMSPAPTGSNVAVFEFWGPGRNNTINCRSVEGGTIGCSIARQSYGRIDVTAYDVDGIAAELADCSYSIANAVVHGNGNTTSGTVVDGTNIGAIGNILNVTGSGITGQMAYVRNCDDTMVNISCKLTVANSHGLRVIKGNGTQGFGVIDAGGLSNALPLTWDASSAACTGGGFTGTIRNGVAQVLSLLATSGSWNRLKFDLAIDNCAGFVFTSGTHGNNIDLTWNSKSYSIATSGRFHNYTGRIGDFVGNGNPEGALTAGVGSTFKRMDGSNGAVVFVKASGAGNTGWQPIALGAAA